MRIALDTIAKVGFGVELNCLEGSSKEGAEFMKAFDDSNEMIYWRIVDLFWKLKRFLNIGSEAALKKNIRVIDSFVYNVISTKRELLAMQRDCVSLFSFFFIMLNIILIIYISLIGVISKPVYVSCWLRTQKTF